MVHQLVSFSITHVPLSRFVGSHFCRFVGITQYLAMSDDDFVKVSAGSA